MCGFLGVFSLSDRYNSNKFSECLNLMRHRGPDNSSVISFPFCNGKLTLGHNRLSILDLDSEANQPMFTVDKKYYIVFNGEIYNYLELRNELKKFGYSFKTESDTEVLLYSWMHWRDDCTKKLVGMYSFAIVDIDSGIINFYRDHFGIKPFFYYITNDALIFSSDISAILPFIERPSIDIDTISDYLLFGMFDWGESSFIRNIKHIRSGSRASINLRNLNEIRHDLLKQVRWWNPSIDQTFEGSFEEASETLSSLMYKSVSLHMRSDVPVGAALSGGLDSSSIVCIINKLFPNHNLDTFTYKAKGRMDESLWAELVSLNTNSTNHQISFSEDDFLNDIVELVTAQGEPFGSPSTYAGFLVYKEIANCGVKVSLDGQGADEIFGGYDYYIRDYITSLFYNKKFKLAANLCGAALDSNKISRIDVMKSLLPTSLIKRLSNLNTRRIYTERFFQPLNSNGNFKPSDESLTEINTHLSQDRKLVATLRYSVQEGPLQSILRTMDRNSMWSSCENRVPFLNQNIAEFAFSLPESFLMSSTGQGKEILRSSMKEILPEKIYKRKDKIGFTPEFQGWIYKREVVRDYIENIKNILPINLKNIFAEFEEKNVSEGSTSDYLFHWRLLNFAVWYDIFIGNRKCS